MLMGGVVEKKTATELVVRRLVHGRGYRFRLNRKDLPGTPDIVLPRRRKAIFVHGCYWHAHGCKIGGPPKSRLDYWLPKLAENKRRDLEKSAALEASDWQVLSIWQCETRNPRGLAKTLSVFLDCDISDRHSAVGVVVSPQYTDVIRS